jgi:hypothetical protein
MKCIYVISVYTFLERLIIGRWREGRELTAESWLRGRRRRPAKHNVVELCYCPGAHRIIVGLRPRVRCLRSWHCSWIVAISLPLQDWIQLFDRRQVNLDWVGSLIEEIRDVHAKPKVMVFKESFMLVRLLRRWGGVRERGREQNKYPL